MANFIQPLDFKTILVNTLAGSVELFVFLSILVIAAGSAFFKIPDKIFIILIALYIIVLRASLDVGGLYLIVLLVTGLVIFTIIARIVR